MKVIASKPWRVKKEAQRLAELHKSIQQKVDFKLPNCKTRLKDNISKTELLQDDVKTRLYKYIDELEEDNILCHGDFHPDNVLITKDGEIIIDWMTATQGNPLADIARTSVMFKFGQIEQWKLPVAAARLNEWLPQNEKTALLKFVNVKMENIK